MTTAPAGRRILVMCAHPDDADVHAGGTVARWIDLHHEVRYVVFTSGDKGHADPAITRDQVIAVRRAEQRAAADILGVPRVTFLDYSDGDLAQAGPELAKTATRVIREERPEIVLTHDPFVGAPRYATYQLHPDHRALGLAVLDATYFRAPGHLYYPEQVAAGLGPHRVREILLMSWRVERMPREADIRLREREDVAASLFLFFGDPGLGLLDWKPVPTLRYAWAAERVPIETVVDSPYLPGTVRTLVVESGKARLGRWLTARRNVAADFEKAFGHAPRDIIQAIALFTDNDQTREPAEAAYGAARALCAPG